MKLVWLVAALAAACLWDLTKAHAADCDNVPLSVKDATWCKFFATKPFRDQHDSARRVDQRVKDAMGVSDLSDKMIRSYAFVVSVWDYDFDDGKPSKLDAVEHEQPDVLNFLEGQQFDEVLMLQNKDATADRIRKIFTEYYLPQFYSASNSGQKIRFMFIFDGHGWQPMSPEATGALALVDLQDQADPDYDHRFSLAELRGLLQDVAPYTQSMIALLGSCYSGSVFAGKAFAEDVKPGPSAWIAAAAPASTEAWVLPDKTGTLFFQDLFTTIAHWKGDAPDLPAGDSASTVNFANLTPKLARVLDAVNEAHSHATIPKTSYPYPPFSSDTVSVIGSRNAPFRFIVPTTVKLINNVDLGAAAFTGSAIVGHPEIRIVHTPEYYKIKGVDLSQYDGEAVPFAKLKSSGLRFAYLRASVGAAQRDRTFAKNLEAATAAGLAVGAYHFFDYCTPADVQFENIKSVVPARGGLLPIAIDLEWNRKGTDFFVPPAACGGVINIKTQLAELLNDVSQYYKTTPIIYTASAFEKQFKVLGDDFKNFPIWLADYSKSAREGAGPAIFGDNPWTIWQIDNKAELTDVPGKRFDLNVFFGSEDQFNAFSSGKGNIALEAAR